MIIEQEKHSEYNCCMFPDVPCNGHKCMAWVWTDLDHGHCGHTPVLNPQEIELKTTIIELHKLLLEQQKAAEAQRNAKL